jgi:hypothetical protein
MLTVFLFTYGKKNTIKPLTLCRIRWAVALTMTADS